MGAQSFIFFKIAFIIKNLLHLNNNFKILTDIKIFPFLLEKLDKNAHCIQSLSKHWTNLKKNSSIQLMHLVSLLDDIFQLVTNLDQLFQIPYK